MQQPYWSTAKLTCNTLRIKRAIEEKTGHPKDRLILISPAGNPIKGTWHSEPGADSAVPHPIHVIVNPEPEQRMPFQHKYSKREMEDCHEFLMCNQGILEYIEDKDGCYEHDMRAWSEWAAQYIHEFHTEMIQWMRLVDAVCIGQVLKYFAVHEPESLLCFESMSPHETLE